MPNIVLSLWVSSGFFVRLGYIASISANISSLEGVKPEVTGLYNQLPSAHLFTLPPLAYLLFSFLSLIISCSLISIFIDASRPFLLIGSLGLSSLSFCSCFAASANVTPLNLYFCLTSLGTLNLLENT